jgi:hypothetical protein
VRPIETISLLFGFLGFAGFFGLHDPSPNNANTPLANGRSPVEGGIAEAEHDQRRQATQE